MYNFIKKLLSWTGRDINDYQFEYYGSYLVAKDLTQKEVKDIEKTIKYCEDNNIQPISGYIFENKKGSYFCPSNCMALGPMKIDCEKRKLWGKLPEESVYSLKMGYASKKKT